MKTVKLKMFDARPADHGIIWAEDYAGGRRWPLIRPGDTVTAKYLGSTVVMKVVSLAGPDEMKAEVAGFDTGAFPVDRLLRRGTKVRLTKRNVFTCEASGDVPAESVCHSSSEEELA